jgi:hypothetical protein
LLPPFIIFVDGLVKKFYEGRANQEERAMYKYAMATQHRAMIYRETDDGELWPEAEIDGSKLNLPGDIKAIARATVAALNGEVAEPRVVWHPKAVEALRGLDTFWSEDFPYGPDSSATMLHDTTRDIWRTIREALALVDHAPPAEKVVGWGAMSPANSYYPVVYARDSKDDAIKALVTMSGGCRLVRLVEEPDQ